jgi:PII-like signaling protein
MKGYQLSFFTQQDHQHGHRPLAEWLLETALQMGIGGATLVSATEGFGQHRRIHSAHFFELADQPVEVTLAVSEADAARLFERLKQEGIDIFYTQAPIEFGMTGQRQAL